MECFKYLSVTKSPFIIFILITFTNCNQIACGPKSTLEYLEDSELLGLAIFLVATLIKY